MAQGSRYLSSDSSAPYRGYTTAGNTNNEFRENRTPEFNDDLKNIEFNALVRQINPAFQAEYLAKIQNFLKFDSECSFPGIPPSLQLFLEKIASDHNHLLSWEFDFTCNRICNEIVEITQRNEKIYEWVCFYQYEYGQTVLKYKKVFHPIHMEENHRTITLTNQNSDIGYSPPHTPPLPQSYTTNNNMIQKERTHSTYDKASDNYQSSECVTLPPTAEPMDNLTQTQKRIVRTIQSVSDNFIVTALKKYIEFLKDDKRDTLQYEKVSVREAEFLIKINKFFTYQVNNILSNEVQNLVEQLKAFIRKNRKTHIGVKIVEKKISKENRLRNVKITKKKAKVRKGDAAHKLDSEINKALSDMAIEYNPTEMFLKSLGKHNNNEATIKETKKDSTSSERIKSKESSTTDVTRKKDDVIRRNPTTQPSIQWQSAGNMYDENDTKNIDDTLYKSDTLNKSDTKNRSDTINRINGRDGRKRGHKIIEALSQPIESKRAVRMMKLMGWSGGALGVRGEGITEPIMPALDLKSGAGFGHSSPSRRPLHGRDRRDGRGRRDRSPLQYRIRVLGDMWDLLQSGGDSTTSTFQSPLKLRERRFIRNSVGAFNGRNNVGLSSETEKQLVANIKQYMQTHLDHYLDYNIDDTKCSLTILITKSRVKLTRKAKLEKHNVIATRSANSTDSDEDDTKTIEIKTSQVEEILRELKNNVSKEINDKKSRRNRIGPIDMKSAYKIMFLKNIQSFLRGADSKIHYVYQENITAKQCRWIENIILNCNRRERAKYNTRQENELYQEIRNYIDCKLRISFGRDTRTMTLKKEYETRRDSTKAEQSKVDSKQVENKIYICDSDEESKTNCKETCKFPDKLSECDSDLSIEDLLVIDDCDEDSLIIAEADKESDNLNENSKENKELESIPKENKNLEGSKENKHVKNSLSDELKSDKNSHELMEENIKEIEKLLQKEDPLQIKVQISLINNNSKNDDIVVISDELSSNTSVASKRSRNDSDNSLTEVVTTKKLKIDEEKTVAVVTDNERSINKSIATQIQDAILKTIDKLNKQDLPSLKCHGVIDKTLQYTCFNEKSYEFIEKIIENVSTDDCRLKLIVLNDTPKVIRKLSLRLNSFLNEHPGNILNRFKKYYSDLNTDVWDVIFENKHEDYLLLTVVVDESSYKVIFDNQFCLDNGIDRAEFSVIWT